MIQENKYYEHSGAIGITGPIYMLIAGVVGSLILSTIYGYAIFYIPFIYLNFFLTLGLGGCVGVLVGYGGKFGKVRNIKALLLFGLLAGLFAEYAGWASWIHALSNQQALILMPSDMFKTVQLVAKSGAWSIFGWTPTGVALYFIWGIEAIMVIGASTIGAWAILSSTPFCERCEKWIEDEDVIIPLEPIENTEELISKLEQGDFSTLKALKKITPEPTPEMETETETENGIDAYTQIKLLHCPDCQQNNFLTIDSVTIGFDSDGKEETDEATIVENLVISPENFKALKEQW